MPTAFIFESDSIDATSYDQLMKGLGREALDAPSPDGFIAHIAGPRDGGGWRVVDVWETPEAADAFYSSPEFSSVVTASPIPIDARPWPLHRIETYTALRQLD